MVRQDLPSGRSRPILYHYISCVFRIFNNTYRLALISFYRPCLLFYRPCFIFYRPGYIPRHRSNSWPRSIDDEFRILRISAILFVAVDVSVFYKRPQNVVFNSRDKVGQITINKARVFSNRCKVVLVARIILM